MNLIFQSIFKDLMVKLLWFHLVSFRFVEYGKPFEHPVKSFYGS